MDGFENVPRRMGDEPPRDPASRRRLRIVLIVVGSALAVSGLLVVGLAVAAAYAISNYGSNK
jgi:hypothetical protein